MLHILPCLPFRSHTCVNNTETTCAVGPVRTTLKSLRITTAQRSIGHLTKGFVQCDFRFGLFFRFSFVLVLQYFFVLVSFQFYSIGDFYKYVMMHITSHQHILLNGVLYAGTFVE